MDKQQGLEAAVMRLDTPPYEADHADQADYTAGAAGAWGGAWGESGTPRAAAPRAAREQEARDAPHAYTAADIYQEVQRSAAFLEVRGRYRGFVVPATVAFLSWYLAYVLAATLAPGVMAHPVAGAVNVAMIAGLAQFLTTFVLTWAYVRHARLNRDRAALELRWTVLDRGVGQAASRGRAS
ncbi:DUF485 domain-containing protein [Streptomyces sp. NBC_01497]|uniref:DUF485 domain-containing protein n=1 Tax=Streptomyces sp. NBC_01497 TaxID=2903885 RepID=UPI002E2FACE9|nr:DUF485 domain-containing protein [Streptomyces sp. NBC_01497]